MGKTEDLGTERMLSPAHIPPPVTRAGLQGWGGPEMAAPQSVWGVRAGRNAEGGHGGPPSRAPTRLLLCW